VDAISLYYVGFTVALPDGVHSIRGTDAGRIKTVAHSYKMSKVQKQHVLAIN
jgi:hypothetical protein